jgi:predicted  nucleic acid-binding Zn-ribbon protein
VDPQAVDESTLPAGDVRSVEGNFKALWESARRAADLIAGLRQERQALQEHLVRLERELQQVRAESAQFRKETAEHAALLERELQQVRAESAQFRKQTAEQVQEGGMSFAGGERDLLAAKVKELIAKLDAYL